MLASAQNKQNNPSWNAASCSCAQSGDSPAVSVTAAKHPFAFIPPTATPSHQRSDWGALSQVHRLERLIWKKKKERNKKRGESAIKATPSRAWANFQLVCPQRQQRNWLELKPGATLLHRRGAILPRWWDSRCALIRNECAKCRRDANGEVGRGRKKKNSHAALALVSPCCGLSARSLALAARCDWLSSAAQAIRLLEGGREGGTGRIGGTHSAQGPAWVSVCGKTVCECVRTPVRRSAVRADYKPERHMNVFSFFSPP